MKFTRTPSGKLKKGVKPPAYYGYKAGDPIQIEVKIKKCHFVTPFPKAIDKALAAPYPGYFFMKAYKNGGWDGHEHFVTRAGYFPTGLLALVYHVLTTGINPLIPEGNSKRIVLPKPADKVDIIVADEMKPYWYPGLLYMWDDYKPLSTLDPTEGTFEYPVHLLNRWNQVKGDNALAKPLLALCRDLHK